jgi:protein-tyrosine kinase
LASAFSDDFGRSRRGDDNARGETLPRFGHPFEDIVLTQELIMEAAGTGRASDQTGPVTFSLSREVVVRSLPGSATAESTHALRSHIVARHMQEGRRGLAICETENSGATFVAVNLAISLADSGVRTLLIDTNMREPELDRFIQPSQQIPGLSDAIAQGDVPIGFALHTVMPNFSLLYAGAPRDSSLELLGSARFARIVDLCLREFDFTLATSAPSNRFADSRRVASVLKHALIVARKDVTFTQDVSLLVQELISDQVSVIGTVFKSF